MKDLASRLIAMAVDLLFLLSFTNALTLFLFGSAIQHSYWSVLIIIVGFWVLRSAMQKTFGGSLGQLMGPITLGREVTLGQALLRNSWILLYVIPSVGPWVALMVGVLLIGSIVVRDDGRGIHDAIACTKPFRSIT